MIPLNVSHKADLPMDDNKARAVQRGKLVVEEFDLTIINADGFSGTWQSPDLFDMEPTERLISLHLAALA
jgi:hypothetical protein